MKKKKRLTAIATGIFAMLLMVGCSKAEDVIEEKPTEPKASEISEEKPAEKETIRGQVTDLTVRKTSPASGLSDTMIYTEGVAQNVENSIDSSIVGLENSIFSVAGGKGGTSYWPSLNTDGLIKLYSNRTTGDGSYIDVSVTEGYQIVSISISYKSLSTTTVPSVFVGETKKTLVDDACVIDAQSFRIKNSFDEGGSTNKQVHINSVVINYEAAAKDVSSELETQTALSYNYVKNIDSATDILDRSITGRTSNRYGDWTYNLLDSGINYSGNSAGDNESIQLRGSDNSGIVTTTTKNGYLIKKITIEWFSESATGKYLYFYGKKTAYTGHSDLYSEDTRGTELGNLRSNDRDMETHKHSLEVTGSYMYLGIKANSALYVKSIEIEWEALPVYTYSNVAIRFGGLIKKPLWDRLEDIQGYGVMVAASDNFDGLLKAQYNPSKVNEACAGEDIKNYYTPLTLEKTNPAEANEEQKSDEARTYYIWNLYQRISTESLTKDITSVAYIKLADEVVFLQETTTNVSDLADELLASGSYVAEDFDGSLKNLADLA